MKVYSILLMGILSLIAFLSCTPAALSTVPETNELVWDAESYELLESRWDSIVETTGIDTLSFKSVRVLKSLFAGSIDRRNPSPDYDKSFEYARILSSLTQRKENEEENWHVVLEWVVNEDNVAGKIQKQVKRLNRENKRMTKKASQRTDEVLSLTKENKQLKKDLAAQEATIEKLKKLEVLMEQERQSY